ncbi:RNA polymerase factor sigma-54 [Bordetella hinzii]|uniref:RNA polymerase sigma-54 factor n=2 Tax=Bordetella hinzii TaxID=103855 RepID=A0ABR4R3I8_9BORD|nr:RNA polymerase factor sigma-54 [Bordetella hinzii]KCB24637.1 RNA polymerase sigma-54 factor [Bordetella hinzii OH87 BAL007II]
MSYASQELQLRQGMALAPRLQQSVKFLQMSTLEFQQAVQHALASNPFLEEPEEEAPAPPPAAAEPAHVGEYPRPRAEGDSDIFEREPALDPLRDRLVQALATLPLSRRDRTLALYLIDALDLDGYLRRPLQDLAVPEDFDPPPDESEWRTALHHVQQLHAPGIGARDLRECLLLQLRAMPAGPAQALALRIVERHLARLARNDWPALRRELQSDDATLHEACALIRGLDPKPGLRYDDQPTPYVVPDVMVDKVGERWRVRVNEAAMPRARLHQQYAEWFQHAHCANRESLLRELQEARWLVRNVEQRHATIQRVAEAIVLRQRRFFDYGDVALRPLMLREVAEDLEIHESTVSRATASKYMSTPRGLFEFRHFFSRELGTEAGGSCSASAVRALIRELIDAENPAQPLSDVDLTQQLARHGIVVARRTVTKYRGQLKISAVELRRAYG